MLTALEVENTKKIGRHADSNGLYLEVDKQGNKRWISDISSIIIGGGAGWEATIRKPTLLQWLVLRLWRQSYL